MTDTSNTPKIPIREFVGTRQSSLFQTLKQPQFTGELILGSSRGEEWIFHFYLGRITFATGGNHQVRRWIRSISKFAPVLTTDISSLDESIFTSKIERDNWEYSLLGYWLKKDAVTRQQLTQIIRNIVVEILFDVTQRMEVVFQLKNQQSLPNQLIFIDPDQVISQAWQEWQTWQGAKLADRFPNQCPMIRQADKLQARTSPRTYEIMTKLFNGKNSLRDLSVQINQDLTQMTRSMLPYIQMGLIDLVEIPDLPCPFKFSDKS